MVNRFRTLSFLLMLLPGLAWANSSDASTQASALVADYESGVLMNDLGLASGTWNLHPEDEDQAYTRVEIVDMARDYDAYNRALKLEYSVDSRIPAQNGFWTKLGNFDASPYDHLYFDVKGDPGAGFTDIFKLELKKYKNDQRVEKISGAYEVRVSSDWQTVKVPLNRLTGIMDFSNPEVWKNPALARKNLDELVIIFHERQVSEKRGVIYIDNIRFVKTGSDGPSAVDFPERKVEKTETRIEGLEFAKFLIGRLGGFPKRSLVSKKFSGDPDVFLREVARDTWGFFDEIVDQEHGLPLDTIQISEKKKALDEDTWIGDYTNVTNIGVYLMVLVSAHELGLLTKEETLSRIQKTFNTLEKLEYHVSGFPYNYYDTTTLEKTSYFVSLVDTGWLLAGIYVAKNAFPEVLWKQADRLLGRGDLIFFYDVVEQQMAHGYYANLRANSDYRYGVFYTEPRATSYIAIARGEVPVRHWFEGLIRTFPESYAWQEQEPVNRVKRTTLGYEYSGGYYEWKGLKYVPSWGGSAFEALMPTLILKEKDLAPGGLGLNNQSHVWGQIRYAKEELGYPVWGMSPSSVPEGGYSEFGAKPFGSKGYEAGVVTPHASILALEYAPEEVIENMRKLIDLYPIYGEYGFYDAVTVATGKVARKYLALDQGMIFVAITNYLKNGVIREHFHRDPIMKSAEKILTSERFFS